MWGQIEAIIKVLRACGFDILLSSCTVKVLAAISVRCYGGLGGLAPSPRLATATWPITNL